MSKSATHPSAAETLRKLEDRWTKPLIDAGWTAIPSIFIEKQAALGLDAIDMNILVHLSKYWWKADNLPHPSVATIAAAIGIKPRAVQKRMKALEGLGFITRHARRTAFGDNDTNLYSFEGLIKAAAPYAVEKIAAREKRDQEERERVARKRPKLALVES
ncbi:MAG: helix-turn-helix domain-containing protein [Rhizomicrobium sp.]